MTHITKLTEIIDGRLLPSDKKLSASLLEVDAGRLTVSENTLGFDATGLATETFVSNAIASAQLGGGEVDLSGYATKADLEDYSRFDDVSTALFGMETVLNEKVAGLATKDELLTKVDKIEGKGLSTNDYTDADKAKVDGIDTSISTAVNTAITGIVDGAPETFDTLKEIATWIETDGAAATDLATDLAGKADRSELENYATVVAMTQLEGQVSDGLSNKVDKEAGKGLSTEDFTTVYKTKLDTLETTYVTGNDFVRSLTTSVEDLQSEIEDELDTKLNIPTSTDPSTVTTPTVNSIPLYTLGNNGEYVLCTPDTWFLINGFYVPGYSATTLGV